MRIRKMRCDWDKLCATNRIDVWNEPVSADFPIQRGTLDPENSSCLALVPACVSQSGTDVPSLDFVQGGRFERVDRLRHGGGIADGGKIGKVEILDVDIVSTS